MNDYGTKAVQDAVKRPACNPVCFPGELGKRSGACFAVENQMEAASTANQNSGFIVCENLTAPIQQLGVCSAKSEQSLIPPEHILILSVFVPEHTSAAVGILPARHGVFIPIVNHGHPGQEQL